MTMEEFKQAQVDTERREFLPKKRPAGGSDSRHGMVGKVKPFHRESEVCGYVFDLLDSENEKRGTVVAEALVSHLTSPVVKDIVNTSSTLALIVRGSEGKLLQCLSEGFRPLAAGGPEDSVEVSREEWLEFCALVETLESGQFAGEPEGGVEEEKSAGIIAVPPEPEPPQDVVEENPFVTSQY